MRTGALAGALFGLGGAGCILDSSGYFSGSGGGGAGGSGGTTTSTTSDGGSSTSTSTVGGGGTGGSTSTTGGGGTGGATSSGGTGTGGSPGTPLSCKDALDNFDMTKSGVAKIDVDGMEGALEPFEVYCDQEHEGGGWTLVHNSVGDPDGKTLEFWQKIFYVDRFSPHGTPSLTTNYFHGLLYKYGKEYRDDVAGMNGEPSPVEVEIRNMIRAKANGANDDLKLLGAEEVPVLSLSNEAFVNNFQGGWVSSDGMGSPEAIGCGEAYLHVAQHYGSCLRYSLGADTADADPTVDLPDSGWGPHVMNSVLTTLNAGKPMAMQIKLQGSGYSNHSSRVTRISRFTRWPL